MSNRRSHKSRPRNWRRALSAAGLAIALLGLVLDALPGTRSGLHSLQLLAILFGLVLALLPWLAPWLARWHGGRAIKQAVIVCLATFAALELALIAIGYETYFPREATDAKLQPAPWWTCENPACHYVADEIEIACAAGQLSGRQCIVNAQGFHDTQDFAASPELMRRRRILALGDSFTFGEAADIGYSYIETIEAQMPEAEVWNTGIFGVGSNQALAAFRMFAPIMQPQLTIYGFYINDFFDNLFPVDGYFVAIDEMDEVVKLQQYQLDPWGTATKIDAEILLNYRYRGVEAPANDLERALGATRLGSILIRGLDAAGKNLGLAQAAQYNRMLELTRGYLRDLIAESAALDSQLLVMLIPEKTDLAKPGSDYRLAAEMFEELGISYFAPRHMLDADRDYAPDWHWNSSGHEKVGAKLGECIAAYFADGGFEACDMMAQPG